MTADRRPLSPAHLAARLDETLPADPQARARVLAEVRTLLKELRRLSEQSAAQVERAEALLEWVLEADRIFAVMATRADEGP